MNSAFGGSISSHCISTTALAFPTESKSLTFGPLIFNLNIKNYLTHK